jgi:hypothetical protein
MVGIRALWPFVDDPNGTFVAATTSAANGVMTVNKAQGNPINDPNDHAKTASIVVAAILSALLLAGGANGIHSVVTAFTSFFENNAQNNQSGSS